MIWELIHDCSMNTGMFSEMTKNSDSVIQRKCLKGTYYAKSTFTWCLDINVCWQCVNTTTLQWEKSIHSSLFNPL